MSLNPNWTFGMISRWLLMNTVGGTQKEEVDLRLAIDIPLMVAGLLWLTLAFQHRQWCNNGEQTT